jgi:hypothetical protein
MIEEHPTWWKYHATKLDDYLTCNRYAFYKTILGWQREDKHNHRAFGSAWHELMEAILLLGYNVEGLYICIGRFLKKYR